MSIDAWDKTKSYVEGDTVIFNGRVYYATEHISHENTGQDPTVAMAEPKYNAPCRAWSLAPVGYVSNSGNLTYSFKYLGTKGMHRTFAVANTSIQSYKANWFYKGEDGNDYIYKDEQPLYKCPVFKIIIDDKYGNLTVSYIAIGGGNSSAIYQSSGQVGRKSYWNSSTGVWEAPTPWYFPSSSNSMSSELCQVGLQHHGEADISWHVNYLFNPQEYTDPDTGRKFWANGPAPFGSQNDIYIYFFANHPCYVGKVVKGSFGYQKISGEIKQCSKEEYDAVTEALNTFGKDINREPDWLHRVYPAGTITENFAPNVGGTYYSKTYYFIENRTYKYLDKDFTFTVGANSIFSGNTFIQKKQPDLTEYDDDFMDKKNALAILNMPQNEFSYTTIVKANTWNREEKMLAHYTTYAYGNNIILFQSGIHIESIK